MRPHRGTGQSHPGQLLDLVGMLGDVLVRACTQAMRRSSALSAVGAAATARAASSPIDWSVACTARPIRVPARPLDRRPPLTDPEATSPSDSNSPSDSALGGEVPSSIPASPPAPPPRGRTPAAGGSERGARRGLAAGQVSLPGGFNRSRAADRAGLSGPAASAARKQEAGCCGRRPRGRRAARSLPVLGHASRLKRAPWTRLPHRWARRDRELAQRGALLAGSECALEKHLARLGKPPDCGR